MASPDRHGAARQRGAGAARHDLDLVVLAVAQDGRDLGHRLGQDHDQRHLAIGRQRIALVGPHALEVVDDPSPGTMARRAATISDRRARMAGSSGGICMLDPYAGSKKRRKPRLPPLFEFQDLRPLGLAGLEARVGLVDDVDAALAAHDTAVLVAQLHGLEGMADLQRFFSTKAPAGPGEFRKRAENKDPEAPRQPTIGLKFVNDQKAVGGTGAQHPGPAL